LSDEDANICPEGEISAKRFIRLIRQKPKQENMFVTLVNLMREILKINFPMRIQYKEAFLRVRVNMIKKMTNLYKMWFNLYYKNLST
jgi:hypothetical protein